MKYLIALVIGSIVGNIWFAWDTPMVYGWIVALAGWVPHLFEKKMISYGN